MEEKEPLTLKEQADKIKEIAEAKGVSTNFFFRTTFERYLTQLSILNNLSKSIKEDGMLVKKEYVKNRKNLYSNPAVAEYNRTTDSANKTVATLMKIIRGFNTSEDDSTDYDPLLRIINGGEDNDPDE